MAEPTQPPTPPTDVQRIRTLRLKIHELKAEVYDIWVNEQRLAQAKGERVQAINQLEVELAAIPKPPPPADKV